MVLKIKLGKKRERRLKIHLEKEHPSVRGRTELDNENLSTRPQINRIIESTPQFKYQAMKFTEL